MTTLHASGPVGAGNKADVDKLLSILNSSFSSAERLVALNLNTARTLLEDSAAHVKLLLAAKDVPELIRLQSSSAQPLLERAVSHARGVYGIASQTQREISGVVEDQWADFNSKFGAVFDTATGSAPAGSDIAVAAVKSALAATHTAYSSAAKAARKVSEIAEANVVTALDTSAKSLANGAPATKARKTA